MDKTIKKKFNAYFQSTPIKSLRKLAVQHDRREVNRALKAITLNAK